ncbi:1,4-alpha-glucan branching protein GlgB [Pseudomonas oryzihabitans]|uniref:1,4-alpha-glucan branching enzyme GlgB n=1 Tax=Pseudomonas oryzihabitans TaxID=47885 RepID=A0AAJ2BUW3_9PSED|nr:1,4-alpha-glucan branching protein GlgB [Pseudomonas psychrotolerans]MDR6236979.1 1,4-alpha-glucan branching enzyme [Pseudomonas psychrotolerans]MDR6353581.1 1,4-alpha-glucan branching enzyme [Pseudomonas psychrotolerans]
MTDQSTAPVVPFDDVRLSAAEAESLARGEHGNPFAILGPHADGEGVIVRAFLPNALGVELVDRMSGRPLAQMQPGRVPGLFVTRLDYAAPYKLVIRWPSGVQETEDPYSFGVLLGETDLYLFNEGRHRNLGETFGAQRCQVDGVEGVRFAVWAPNARRVSVVGDFNSWDGRRLPMRLRANSGVWELFVPRLPVGTAYKYEILGQHGVLPLKADPIALAAELPPRTASVVADNTPFVWRDQDWMARRRERQGLEAPLSIYELHAGSWRREGGDEGRLYTWRELAKHLIPYIHEMGFTHIELLPIMEHPFSGSWGYQPLGQFAPTSRFGTPADFAAFVDACHQANIGVILDWVPAHFPTDEHGLARFDGTALYEYEHPFEGFHQDWNTYIYNLGRHEVHGFMLASAMHWLKHFHIDGLRVDAVASMLYRDYSRKQGEWIPNVHGGRENLETIAFLRHLNEVVHEEAPGALVIAEESTSWPGVSAPVSEGGLGFDYKWNMGWMHDTLHYVEEDPVYRQYHHHQMTFGLVYAWSERFVLPISHDEVVHGKGSLIEKMPGDNWQKFANLRNYLSFMWTHPGKKLLFMGCEFGQWREWSHDRELDWFLLEHGTHRGVKQLLADLNRLYRQEPALHQRDHLPEGFDWVVGDDNGNSVFAWLRRDAQQRPLLVIANFTPVPRYDYRVGVPGAGHWQEIFNSDAECYGGSNVGNGGGVNTEEIPAHGQPTSLNLNLPPLGLLVFKPQS